MEALRRNKREALSRRQEGATLRSDEDLDRRLQTDLGHLYEMLLRPAWATHDLFGFVRHALAGWIEENYHVASAGCAVEETPTACDANPRTLIVPEDVARLLGIPAWMVRELIRRGCLQSSGPQGNQHSQFDPDSRFDDYNRVDVREVLSFRERWRDGLSFEQVARWLGYSEKRVEELAKEGHVGLARRYRAGQYLCLLEN